jgi:hypothetical protein
MNKLVLSAAAAAPVTALLLTTAWSGSASAAQTAPAVAHASRLACSASMTNSRPADYTDTGVKVRTAAGADIETAAHYRTTTHRKYATAGSAGTRTVSYYISGATPGYKVVVDVYVSRDGRNGSCATSFTPHR